jgi:hypothetical protein
MSAISEIWLSDLIRAVALIPGDADMRRRIAELLGLTEQVPGRPPAGGGGNDQAAVAMASSDLADAWSAGDASVPEPPEPGRESERPAEDSVPELQPIDHVPAAPTDWALVPPLPRVTERNLTGRPPAAPLLAPRSAPAILHALAATKADDGPIDIPRLTEEVAAGRPVTRLPRKPYRTLRFGVQVLADVGEAMELFARDQEELISRIKSVAGTENVTVSVFADSPTRGTGPGSRRTWRAYHPPGAGCRVLIVSDFGIGGPPFHLRRSQPAEWRDFMVQVRKGGCYALGLVPYPPDRWPGYLRRLLPLVVWDRVTTAAKAVTSAGGR